MSKWQLKPNDEATLEARKRRFATPMTQDYGFVSRGEDERLQRSSQERQDFFKQIQHQFTAYCVSEQLPEYMEKVVNSRVFQQESINVKLDNTKSGAATERDRNIASIDKILESLRKLREALLYQSLDEFGKRVFLFSIRASAPLGKYQTYIPSITYLLENGKHLLSKEEIEEVVSLLILHLVHYNETPNEASRIYHKYKLSDQRLWSIIVSWSTNDHHRWIKLYNSEIDGCRIAIMSKGVSTMLQIMVQEFSSAFFTIKEDQLKLFLPSGVSLDQLAKYGWKQVNGMVIIRERK